jgi:hypothetical protein
LPEPSTTLSVNADARLGSSAAASSNPAASPEAIEEVGRILFASSALSLVGRFV